MRITRKSAAVAVLAASALALTACSGSSGGDESSSSTSDNAGLGQETAVNIAWNQPFYSYNQNTATGNATANAIIKYLMTDGFNYYDKDLNLVQDPGFGSYEKVSDDPLTIKYTFADTAMWSDGVAVTPADFLLEWAAQSGKFNNVEPTYDEDYNVTNQDELDAGIYFDAGGGCVQNYISQTPAIDGNTITLTYDKPFADWETCMTGSFMPAHVVAQRALGIDDPTEATQALVDAIDNEDLTSIAPISQVWSNDFNYTSLPDDASLYLSNGAYLMTDFVQDQYMTLKANADYTGDHAATIDTVTIRWNGDAMGQVQALQNGEVDLISPQSTADVLEALKAIDGLTVTTEDEAVFEHVDLQFANGGPFDPATYGGDADVALKVRQAFLHTIPRQQIVDNLIKPLNPNAELRQSFTVVPGSPNYDAVVAANGQADVYGSPDIETAASLLADAGVTTPVQVRLLYDPNNPRRQNEYELIAASAKDAGFDVVPYEVQNGWGADLDGAINYYDAALFGWQSTSTAVTESDANYRTGGLNNFYGYSNPEVDALFDQLGVETDSTKQGEILGQIEKHLVDDAFGVTLFQFPGVTGWNPANIGNVQKISLSPTIFYGFWEWTPGDAAAAS
ncbi:ABC transporter family substrate-binding protein [Actinotalea sp. M2MS4P-6]|uniref:ABC transporter family substrate-binding protein n=1 Tax=Actinotalea sp. M2MS4P-6 TaxID=2983762 RepID=UPI0021E41613|nr:ABC transporter family substrate-binding protein [Actinotalea sp. M2MS4P-6]MCV2396411.1 ABC transporter family substrate-binding protein [Actinotalea sp. M2MS4P-6]